MDELRKLLAEVKREYAKLKEPTKESIAALKKMISELNNGNPKP